MKTLLFLNYWTNDILLNLFALRFTIQLVKIKTMKLNPIRISILCFLGILLLDNWLYHLTIHESTDFYYAFTSSVFLSLSTFKNTSTPKQLALIILCGTTQLFINSPILIQMAFGISMILLLIEIKNHLLKSSQHQTIAFVLIAIILYIYSILQEYTFSQVGGNWAKSNFLIYFSICDYIIFSLMLLIIHVNVRRLFFN